MTVFSVLFTFFDKLLKGGKKMENETKNSFIEIIQDQETEISRLKKELEKTRQSKIKYTTHDLPSKDIHFYHHSDFIDPKYYELKHQDINWQYNYNHETRGKLFIKVAIGYTLVLLTVVSLSIIFF